MRRRRVSIGGLMMVVLIASFGMAALRAGTEPWAGAVFLGTCAVLALAVVGVVCGGPEQRAWWLGFALFGIGYLVLTFWLPARVTRLPTSTLLRALDEKRDAPGPGLRR